MPEERIAVEGYFGEPPETTQFYETTLAVRIGRELVPVTFGSIPARSLDSEHRSIGSLSDLVDLVDGDREWMLPITTPQALVTTVGYMLDPELQARGADQLHPAWYQLREELSSWERAGPAALPPWWRHPRRDSGSPLPAAEFLVFSAPIPFETSPLSGPTLAALLGGSTGTAVVGVVIVGAATPWLLAAIPAGVILMKVSEAAGDVMKYRILRALAPELLDKPQKRKKPRKK